MSLTNLTGWNMRSNSPTRPFLLGIFFLSLLCPAISLAQGRWVHVYNVPFHDVLNIRQTASNRSPIVGTLPYNGKVYALEDPEFGTGKAWVRVKYQGHRGWAHTDYLMYKTGSVDVTRSWRQRIGQKFRSIGEAAIAFKRQLARQYGRDSMPTNIQVFQAPTRLIVLDRTGGDHSIMGQELTVEFMRSGRSYRLDTVLSRQLCWNGANGANCQ